MHVPATPHFQNLDLGQVPTVSTVDSQHKFSAKFRKNIQTNLPSEEIRKLQQQGITPDLLDPPVVALAFGTGELSAIPDPPLAALTIGRLGVESYLRYKA
jgi:hypothetical protein